MRPPLRMQPVAKLQRRKWSSHTGVLQASTWVLRPGQAPGAGVPTSWAHLAALASTEAVLIQPGVGVVFRSGSIKTLGHQPTVGTRDGWPSLLVGGHGQGAGAADAGGCRVLGPSAHKAGLAALAVVTLSVVLAALGRGNSSAPTVEASLPPAPSPAMQGPCPGHPPLPRPQHTHNPTLCLWCLLPTPHRSPLTTQTPEPGRQRSEWPWH